MIRPHRLFVSGGSRLSPQAALLWKELGKLLAAQDELVVITGGLAGRVDSPGCQTADRMIIDGVLEGLHGRRIPADERIETFLPDQEKDGNKLVRFREGRIRVMHHRTPQSRRFSLVHSADVVISIEGAEGTRSVLDVALAIERPVLPLPFAGGASAQVWKDLRDEICHWFQIPQPDAAQFEQLHLADLGKSEVRLLAERVRSCLVRGFTRSCFVIMSFQKEQDRIYDSAIRPALEAHGLLPVRTDRLLAVGNIVEAIRDGLRHCYFAIADTTGDRPNVMYELGLAHADNKPVILLRRAAADGTLPPTPFDFQTESILKYTDDMDNLRQRLEAAIAVIRGKIRTLDEV
jgi:nucleoside 2-deoxyribosyltransferase